MQVKSIAECSKTFIKLPFFIKIFVLFIFERPFYTGFTVITSLSNEDSGESAHMPMLKFVAFMHKQIFECKIVNNFLPISFNMFWVLKRTISLSRLFWAP